MSNKEKNICWSSHFKKTLKITKKESKLSPLGKSLFKKPANLKKLLNNYSQPPNKNKQSKKTRTLWKSWPT